MNERDKMAQVVAHIVSGVEDAIPEPEDFIFADKLIEIIEKELL